MSRAILNVAAPILVMAVLGALLGLCWRDPVWFYVALPVTLGASGFASAYGYKGWPARRAFEAAAFVAAVTGVISLLLFLVGRV